MEGYKPNVNNMFAFLRTFSDTLVGIGNSSGNYNIHAPLTSNKLNRRRNLTLPVKFYIITYPGMGCIYCNFVF